MRHYFIIFKLIPMIYSTEIYLPNLSQTQYGLVMYPLKTKKEAKPK